MSSPTPSVEVPTQGGAWKSASAKSAAKSKSSSKSSSKSVSSKSASKSASASAKSGAKQSPQSAKSGAKSAKSPKSAQSAQSTKSAKSAKSGAKHGGALVEDIKNLAVPFAILLAKEGLDGVFKKKKAEKAEKAVTANTTPKAAAKPSSYRRKSTISGGACSAGCGMTGGSAMAANGAVVKNHFDSIAQEIEKFLQKY